MSGQFNGYTKNNELFKWMYSILYELYLDKTIFNNIILDDKKPTFYCISRPILKIYLFL